MFRIRLERFQAGTGRSAHACVRVDHCRCETEPRPIAASSPVLVQQYGSGAYCAALRRYHGRELVPASPAYQGQGCAPSFARKASVTLAIAVASETALGARAQR